MFVIVGEEGSGKSYTAIKIGSLVDPDFSADNVFFEPDNVLQRLRDGRYEPGSVWVLDEAGVSMGNRSWHDQAQVKLNKALQLVRNHNLGFIFTLPVLPDLDSQTTRRLQDAFELKSKKEGHHVRGRWWTSKVDRMGFSKRNRTVWWEHPKINGRPLRSCAFTPPDPEVVSAYENTKTKFQSEFYDETIEEMRGDGDGDDSPSVDELLGQITAEKHGVAPFLSWHGGHNKPVISTDELYAEFDISHSEAKRLKDRLRDHGSVDVKDAWSER